MGEAGARDFDFGPGNWLERLCPLLPINSQLLQQGGAIAVLLLKDNRDQWIINPAQRHPERFWQGVPATVGLSLLIAQSQQFLKSRAGHHAVP